MLLSKANEYHRRIQRQENTVASAPIAVALAFETYIIICRLSLSSFRMGEVMDVKLWRKLSGLNATQLLQSLKQAKSFLGIVSTISYERLCILFGCTMVRQHAEDLHGQVCPVMFPKGLAPEQDCGFRATIFLIVAKALRVPSVFQLDSH